MIRLALLAVVIVASMGGEARRAARHERALFARGGIEPRHDVYPFMQVAYPGIFLAMLWEGLFRPAPPPWVVAAGVVVYAAGKLLKWWAIRALGPYWTFRVVVLPGSPQVTDGPYRVMRHPNYVGVMGELIGAALVAGSPVAGSLGSLLFGGLMTLRARVESRARDAILRRG